MQAVVRALTFVNADPDSILLDHNPIVAIGISDASHQSVSTYVAIEPEHLPPTSLLLNCTIVAENAATGTVVGGLSANDLDQSEPLTFSLRDDADGRFKIVKNQLVVASGSKLDYETATSHQITVRVTDKDGLFIEKTFTIGVDNISPEAISGTVGNDVLKGGNDRDVLKGFAANESARRRAW